MTKYHSMSSEEVLNILGSTTKGLSDQEAKNRLLQKGYNKLASEKGASATKIFLSQFTNGFVLLLILAGTFSLFLHEIIESIAIFAVIMLNAILGFVQEYRADRAVEALKKISAPKAIVLRDGQEQELPAQELVPGDIIYLEAGSIVPADARLIELTSLKTEEASLTGESFPAKKTLTPCAQTSLISDQDCMVFMGTVVTYGKGVAVVTATGMATEFGKIATSLQETTSTKTPLQKKFTRLAGQLSIVTLIIIGIVFIAGIIQGTMSFSEMVLIALILTVSTIPKSLPLVVTIGLSLGTKHLAKNNMLIKKLPVAESLGATTIICSDKTGTITKNQMTVTDLYVGGRIIGVTGSGYNPVGEFREGTTTIRVDTDLDALLSISSVCNNAKLVQQDTQWEILGDPTEGSLIVLARKGGFDTREVMNRFVIQEEILFDSERKRMSVIAKDNHTKTTRSYVKGAPDLLLTQCTHILINGRTRPITKKDKHNIMKVNDQFASKALRVLGCAYKDVLAKKKQHTCDEAESELIFVGLVGMIDPPREEVKEAIAQCKRAGIQVMIITGDHAVTTKAVAETIGLLEEGDIVLTGEELSNLSVTELEGMIDKVRIIARAMPVQKSLIVDVLQKRGHIVAMTGDGVNDAPALKKADIGISMGITGTDVAKEVSKAMLVDDNFASIVKAIREGRNIYNTLIRSAKFFLSCNMGEITAVFIAIMLRFPFPLLPLQILIMNLLTDSLPAMGLGFESEEKGIMNNPPRNPRENPITKKIFISIIVFGLIMGLGTFLIFNYHLQQEAVLEKAQTVAFTTLVMFQMFAVMSSRSLYHSLKHLNPFSNLWLLGAVCLSVIIQLVIIYWPPLQIVFGTTALSITDWLGILAISSLGYVMMEVSKFFIKDDGKAIKNKRGVTTKQEAY